MFNELINCTELLQKEFEGWQIARCFGNHIQTAEYIAGRHDDSLTRAELLKDQPWLDVLTGEELDGLLEQAKRIRRKARKKESVESPPDRRLYLARRLQEELARWMYINQGVKIALGRRQYDTAEALLDILDDVYAQNLVDEFTRAEKEADEK